MGVERVRLGGEGIRVEEELGMRRMEGRTEWLKGV